MVEVTKSNFVCIMPQIEKAIRNSSFVAIDTEFTGLDLGAEYNPRLFDTLEERYLKLRERATNFIPCQVGLSAFAKVPHENRYHVETYVFFVRPYMCGDADKRFMCQSSSLDFLCRHDFDFNKFIKEGIPYINEEEELNIRNQIEDGSIGYSYEKLQDLKPKQERDVLINSRFNILPQNKDQSKSRSNELNIDQSKDLKSKLVFPKDKLFHEYFELWELRRKYPSLWAYSDENNIIVEAVSSERKKELIQQACTEKEKLIDFYLGFTKVFRILKEVRKPIVGHNLIMDLLLFYENFHKSLPKSFNNFKKELHSIFPSIYDTRLMWLNIKKVYKFKDLPRGSNLFYLHEMFRSPPDSLSTMYTPGIQIINGDKYSNQEFPHESGYDSYITGCVFLKICHTLAMKTVTSNIFIKPQTFKQHLSVVSTFENQLNIGLSRERYINLVGDDPKPQVAELLHISLKNSAEFNFNELCERFSKYPMTEFKMRSDKKSAVITIGSLWCYRDILRDFKNDPEYVLAKYSYLRHSDWSKRIAIWTMAVGTGCLASFLILKFGSF